MGSPLGDMIEERNEPPDPFPFDSYETPDEPADADPFPPVYDTASEKVIKAGNRPRGAIGYEKKVNDLLHSAVALTVQSEATVVDAATILLAGDKLSKVWGDAAATDERIGRAIDFLEGGAINPVVLAVVTTLPVLMQVGRNHEAQLDSLSRVSIPFTRGRIGFSIPTRFKIRFGGRYRDIITHEPELVYSSAFTEKAVANLEKQGLRVAKYAPKHRAD